MGRNIKNSSGDFNERVMLAMYATDCQNEITYSAYFMRGRGIAHLLGGAWSTYRHRAMLELEQKGVVICLKVRRSGREAWHYALTRSGYVFVYQLVMEARLGAFPMPAQDAAKSREAQLDLFNKVGS